MSPPQYSSPIPRKVWAAVTLVLVALAGLLGRLAVPPAPPVPERGVEPAEPKREPTTDPDEIRFRLIEDRAKQDYVEFNDRVAMSETRACLLEQELRALYARHIALAAGKAGARMRDTFERDTAGWAACFLKLDEVRGRKSLREAADSALLQPR